MLFSLDPHLFSTAFYEEDDKHMTSNLTYKEDSAKMNLTLLASLSAMSSGNR